MTSAVNAVMFMHLSCPFICHQPPFQAGHPIGWKGTLVWEGEAQVETHSLRLWGLPGHTGPQMRGVVKGKKREKKRMTLLTNDEPACQIWMGPKEALITLSQFNGSHL